MSEQAVQDVHPLADNATAAIMAALRFTQSLPYLGVVLTTYSGARYLLVWNDSGVLFGTRRDASVPRGSVKPEEWFRIGGIDDVKPINIWGSLEFSDGRKTTKVVRVELKQRRARQDAMSLLVVFPESRQSDSK